MPHRNSWVLVLTCVALLFTVGMNAYISGKEAGREEMRRVLLPREIPFASPRPEVRGPLLYPGSTPSHYPTRIEYSDGSFSGTGTPMTFGPKLIFEDAPKPPKPATLKDCRGLIDKHVKEHHGDGSTLEFRRLPDGTIPNGTWLQPGPVYR